MLVCNPLMRAYIQLPPAIKDRLVLTVGLATKAYRVLAAGDDLISPFAVKNLTSELYDSRFQQWSMTAPLPCPCNLESGKTTRTPGYPHTDPVIHRGLKALESFSIKTTDHVYHVQSCVSPVWDTALITR